LLGENKNPKKEKKKKKKKKLVPLQFFSQFFFSKLFFSSLSLLLSFFFFFFSLQVKSLLSPLQFRQETSAPFESRLSSFFLSRKK